MAEEKPKVEESREGEEEEEIVRWVNCYSSVHEILLVGDGDFSFSLSLANAFGSASNIVATSLDSYDVLLKKYSKAKSNLESLKMLGATILHRVDAKKMKLHTDLKMRKFDRIIFNFPHAGFKGKEDDLCLINLHRTLVMGFFTNARHMLRPYGEVHVSHKIGGPFRKWNLKELASKCSLVLTECADFEIQDYPGYNNKRGDGLRCDQPFPLGECSTFKFIVGDIHKKAKAGKELASVFQRSFATIGINHNHLESTTITSYLPRFDRGLGSGSSRATFELNPTHLESFAWRSSYPHAYGLGPVSRSSVGATEVSPNHLNGCLPTYGLGMTCGKSILGNEVSPSHLASFSRTRSGYLCAHNHPYAGIPRTLHCPSNIGTSNVCDPRYYSSGNIGPDCIRYVQNYVRESCQMLLDRASGETVSDYMRYFDKLRCQGRSRQE